MTVTLAVTWDPRGELPRLERLLPQLEQVYAGLAFSFPPAADPAVAHLFTAGPYARRANWVTCITSQWSAGRYMALHGALQFAADFVHYADLDRLLRWVETRPEEWQQAVQALQQTDCLVMGRTPAAYQTHPKSLWQTEAISNRVVAQVLGCAMDVSAGSKGFSRRAVEYLLQHTRPERAMGADAEWPILLQRAGFQLSYLTVDGLDWESADHYQERAADAAAQRLAAERVDADPQSWEWRVHVVQEIVEAALEAAARPLPVAALAAENAKGYAGE